jgi:hypothetical protein
LWKIPQRGNQYLRRLFVQGARAVSCTSQALKPPTILLTTKPIS